MKLQLQLNANQLKLIAIIAMTIEHVCDLSRFSNSFLSILSDPFDFHWRASHRYLWKCQFIVLAKDKTVR